MALVFFQGLAWEYLAETLSIFLVQLLVALMAMKKVHTLADACLILSLYPLSLIMVEVLEGMGWN